MLGSEPVQEAVPAWWQAGTRRGGRERGLRWRPRAGLTGRSGPGRILAFIPRTMENFGFQISSKGTATTAKLAGCCLQSGWLEIRTYRKKTGGEAVL